MSAPSVPKGQTPAWRANEPPRRASPLTAKNGPSRLRCHIEALFINTTLSNLEDIRSVGPRRMRTLDQVETAASCSPERMRDR